MKIEEFENLFHNEATRAKLGTKQIYFVTKEGMKINEKEYPSSNPPKGNEQTVGKYQVISTWVIENKILYKIKKKINTVDYFLFDMEIVLGIEEKGALHLIRHELAHATCIYPNSHGREFRTQYIKLNGSLEGI